MKSAEKTYRKLVLVCQNQRPDGSDCCMARGAGDIYLPLKEAVKARDPDIRVSRTGCLGSCLSGPVVVVVPENRWFGDVQPGDIPDLVDVIVQS